MAENKVTAATLVSGPGQERAQKPNKNTEITSDPEVLKQELHSVVVKPVSGVVLGYRKDGAVLCRYFDVDFAQEEIAAAGLEWEEVQAGAVLKREQAEALAAKRTLNRPDRRLRSERRKGRGAEEKRGKGAEEKNEGGKTGKREDGKTE